MHYLIVMARPQAGDAADGHRLEILAEGGEFLLVVFVQKYLAIIGSPYLPVVHPFADEVAVPFQFLAPFVSVVQAQGDPAKSRQVDLGIASPSTEYTLEGTRGSGKSLEEFFLLGFPVQCIAAEKGAE
jgi:hypothetical protein